MKSKRSYYIINAITFYRLIAAPFLLILIFSGQWVWFKWLLAFSFFTDAIDGFLARKYRVVSVLGARMDSIADDFTVLVGIVGLFIYHQAFVLEQYIWMILLLILFLLQITTALIRYGKFTSFHTYLAKASALAQGIFLISAFFLESPFLPLFYIAVAITALDLLEETIMVLLLPQWEADVKGISEVLKKRAAGQSKPKPE